jgi:hypothetical protein
LYSKDAKSNGYGYQAYLMEKQVIPQLETKIEQLQNTKIAAISQMPKSAQGHKRWIWKHEAAAAGMTEQYEFLYAYTSRLLHATPTSVTTDQKNLEEESRSGRNRHVFGFHICVYLGRGRNVRTACRPCWTSWSRPARLCYTLSD